MIKKSTINFWKMQGENAWGIQRVLNMINGYIFYTLYEHCLVSALALLRFINKLPETFFKILVIDFLGNRYHSKVVTYENARKLIALEENIVLPTEECKKIIPWDIANKIILKHKNHLAIIDCPCRLEKKTAGKKYCEPLHTCIFFGKTGVDFVTTHMPRMHGHRATKEEVLSLLDLQYKNNNIFTVWFKDGTGYRAGVMCCCCSCCCGGMEVEAMRRKKGFKELLMMAPSGYSVKVDKESCNACGKCVKICQCSAMSIDKSDGKGELTYSKELCLGCGNCIDKCPQESLSLVVDPDRGAIFDVDAMLKLSKKIQSNARI
jgi:NAD-dependent dihydropyrimidine dehydrogenase PreA subunit